VGDRHGQASGVRFSGSDALFDGTSAINIAEAPSLGDQPFTISLWMKAPHQYLGVIGDLVSQYDASTRTGFALSIKDATAGTANTPNVRMPQFWVDAGTQPRWQHSGRPGGSRMIHALQVHAGHLFAATNETVQDHRGHVFRYDGDVHWIDCGAPDACNAVHSLASVKGELYAATTFDDLRGSLCSPGVNCTPGGAVYRWLGGERWEYCGNPYAHCAELPVRAGWNAIGRICLFHAGGNLLAGNMHHPDLYRYEGGTIWSRFASLPYAVMSAAAVAGHVYVATKTLKPEFYPQFNQSRPAEETIVRVDEQGRVTPAGGGTEGQVYAMAMHDGRIFAGTWPRGVTYRSDSGSNDWLDAGGCGCAELEGQVKGEIMAMSAYHGRLYVGTLPLAEVYRYDGDHVWSKMAQLDMSPDSPLRRVWSMAEFDGRLFCGTLPRGEVHRMEVGFGVMHAHTLGGGWHHLVAVRRERGLQLWLDGRLAAQAVASRLHVTTTAPLMFGSGPQSRLVAALRDIRIFGQALDVREIQKLAQPERLQVLQA
jgi:hypothetical protein